MSARVAVGVSQSFDPVEAFSEAAGEAADALGAPCDLAAIFAAAPHLTHAGGLLAAVHDRLAPRRLIGCGAGGVVGGGREIEEGPGAVVWALAAPGAEIETYNVEAERVEDGIRLHGVPADPSEALLVLADPYSFSAEALLEYLNEEHPGTPVLGGLASAAAAGSACLFRDRDVVDAGAIVCTLGGIEVLACVSQGAEPIGPEMTITACEGNVIHELASVPAIDRLREAIAELDDRQRELAVGGLLVGLVIDENQPEYTRGDFLVRPVVGADEAEGSIAIGEAVRIGQTVRLHVRDPAGADEDIREALRLQIEALGKERAAGALLFTCNGRGRHMFSVPDHDVSAVEDALGAPAAGFFCAGEIGPVGGRTFLHGFTATMAVFPGGERRSGRS
jgi:small ligand-binding sensory domain FIST